MMPQYLLTRLNWQVSEKRVYHNTFTKSKNPQRSVTPGRSHRSLRDFYYLDIATREREGSNKWEHSRLFVWKTMEINPAVRGPPSSWSIYKTYMYTYLCVCISLCVYLLCDARITRRYHAHTHITHTRRDWKTLKKPWQIFSPQNVLPVCDCDTFRYKLH